MTPLTQSYWPADESQPIWNLSAGALLRRAASLAPDTEALIEVAPAAAPSLTGAARTDRRWTYAELLADAERCAGWLQTRFRPGEAVCIWAPNVPEWVIVQYGAALAGLILVTANPALREPELRHVVRQSGAVALIHADQFRGYDMAAIASALSADVREIISLTGFMDRIAGHDASADLPEVDPASTMQIQFTSGTTGLPKGARLTHAGLVTDSVFLAGRSDQAREVWVSPMPLFHTAGSGLGVLGCAAHLSTLVLPCLFDPRLMLEAIAREKATVTSGVPTMLVAMLDALVSGEHDVSSLRVIISGGAPVPPALHARVETGFGAALTTLYGQTEVCSALTVTSPRDTVEDRAATAGRPLPQAEVRIVDPATQAVVRIGVEGEVQARGYQLMQGYVGQPEATARTILPDGWLRTSDLGCMDARGYLRITGRLSDMIIRGGENAYPAEIEAVLARHPAVAEVAVFGLPDERWGEIIAAAVRLRPDASVVDAQALKQHCRLDLAPQKAPEAWFVVDQLPLTPSGKVRKHVLRDEAVAGRLSRLD
jgi:acyl-CoA synthetase (AMP-forming)/AMP-acid ligase II